MRHVGLRRRNRRRLFWCGDGGSGGVGGDGGGSGDDGGGGVTGGDGDDDGGDEENTDEEEQDPNEEDDDPGDEDTPEDPATPVDPGPPGQECGLGSNADSYNPIDEASTYHQETERLALTMSDVEYRQPMLNIAHSTIDMAAIAERDGYREMSAELLYEANGLLDMVNEPDRNRWWLFDNALSFVGGFVQGATGGAPIGLDPIPGAEKSHAWGQLVGGAVGLAGRCSDDRWRRYGRVCLLGAWDREPGWGRCRSASSRSGFRCGCHLWREGGSDARQSDDECHG